MPDIDEIAAHLNGTCMSLQEALFDLYGDEAPDLTPEECAQLDDEVFECVVCGWWHEQCEMAEGEDNDWVCEGCADDD